MTIGATFPVIAKCQRITGHRLRFRNVETSDAEFILSLRTDEKKSRYLSATSHDLQKQTDWLELYKTAQDQAYFIIESTPDEKIGTVRLYDADGDSFSWGSWIMKSGCPQSCAIESALMVYQYGMALGFTKSHFKVRLDAESVWRFHERFGALRTAVDDLDISYSISKMAIEQSMARYARFLPQPIRVTEWSSNINASRADTREHWKRH